MVELRPGHYKPFSFAIGAVPLIVYPGKDEHDLHEAYADREVIRTHLQDLYKAHAATLNHGDYHVVLVWNLNGARMTDVWLHSMDNWSVTSGPLIECQIFKRLDVCDDAGIASGDSIIMVSSEEILRRHTATMEEYLDCQKRKPPMFPEGMQPTEEFA